MKAAALKSSPPATKAGSTPKSCREPSASSFARAIACRSCVYSRANIRPPITLLRQLEREEALIYMPDDSRGEPAIQNGLRLSVDLAGIDGSPIIGYRAQKHAPLIDLAKVQYYDAEDFWDPIRRNESRTLILDPEDFYILASREKVRIPAPYAAEMVPFDPTIGEFRIHYAGFFDPGFGYGSGEINGTRAVLEVRSHEVPFILEDGQVVASLVFEQSARTAQNAVRRRHRFVVSAAGPEAEQTFQGASRVMRLTSM